MSYLRSYETLEIVHLGAKPITKKKKKLTIYSQSVDRQLPISIRQTCTYMYCLGAGGCHIITDNSTLCSLCLSGPTVRHPSGGPLLCYVLILFG